MNLSVFIPYLAARSFMSLANTMLSVAIGWHIYKQTGDPFDLAIVGLVQIIPVLSLFIFSGWVVDHFSRKKILIICSASETILFILLSLVMMQDQINLHYVYILLFLNGCERAFYGPVQQAILPNLVSREYLSQAIAISSTVWNAASTAGPFVAGLLIIWVDRDTYWVFGCLTFLASILFLFLPHLSTIRPTARGWSEVVAGIGFIRKSPLVLGSISLDLFSVLLGSVVALLPIFAVDVLNVGADALGLMRAMPALGAVMVGILLTKYPLKNSGNSLFIFLVIFAGSIVVFAFSKALWLSLLALWVYGASDMVSVNVRTSIIHLATPDVLRGRVSAVNSIFIASSNRMGDFRAGTMASVFSPVATVAIGGVMALAVAIGGYYLFPSIRSLRKLKDIEEKSS